MKKLKNNRKGISLLVLVITIIVIIIIAGAVILNLTKNNPIDNAKKASYLNDLDSFKSDLSMYESSKMSSTLGDFDPTLLQADEASVTYAGMIDTSKKISDVIELLKINTKYIGQLEVVDGELNIKTNDSKKIEWATSAGYKVIIAGEPKVTIGLPTPSIIVPGTDVVYKVTFSSTEALSTINLTDKVFVTDSSNVELSTQPNITLGELSGTSSDILRQVNITVSTNTLTEGTYKLKIKSGTVTTVNNVSNTQDQTSLVEFSIDTSAPENPTMVASPTTPTSGDVAVIITYSEDTVTKEYSTNGTTWKTYTTPVAVSINNTTVYARAKDSVENQSGQSTLTVANIDKDAPTVAYGTNGATNIKTASTTVTVSDTNGINASTLQYVWDTQNVTTPTTGWTAFTNGATLTKTGVTGTYYLWIKATDNAGNNVVSKTNAFGIDNTAPTIAFGTNGGTNATQVSTTITASDVGSGINASSLQYIWDTQNVTAPSSGWAVFTNGATQIKAGDGAYYLWAKATDNAENIVTTVSNKFTVGEVADIASIVQTVNKTFSGATSGYSYNNPVIPSGFVAVNTTDASWNNLSTDYNNGLVIQDASGNQFVWVPVDGTSVAYSKWTTTGTSYASTTDDTLPSGFNVASITTTYKGFYIARYESAFDYNGGSIRVASKKSTNKTSSTNWSTTRNATYNGYLWNYINYTDSKSYAENMATSYGYDTSKVGTNLITGAEWDTTLKWIQNSGKSVTDSRTWGNHNDSTSPANVSGYASLQISGYSNYWKAKNIYDLAGNTWEWTNEIYSSSRVVRGGYYYNSGSTSPAAYRGDSNVTSMSFIIGFRVVLYVL